MAAKHQMSDAEARANPAKARQTGFPRSATMFKLTNHTDVQEYFWMVLTAVSGSTPDYPVDEEITDIDDVYLISTTATGEGQMKSYKGSSGADIALRRTTYGAILVKLAINVEGAYLGGGSIDINKITGLQT